MLGHALSDALAAAGVRCIGTDLALDVADETAVLEFVRRERPGYVINSAAYTRVDDAETNEVAARRVNAEGAACVARAALEVGAPVVYFSTDYVFRGGSSPYPEDAPTAPEGVYARTKLEGERLVLDSARAGGRPYVVRTSWLFGEHGPNFVRTMIGLMRERPELRVVADQRGRPTYTRDLASATLALLGIQAPGPAEPGVYHFANGGDVSWHEFAEGIRDCCRRNGVPLAVERVLPVTTAEFPRPAPRPAYSVLGTDRIEAFLGRPPRPWTEALEAYVRSEFLT